MGLSAIRTASVSRRTRRLPIRGAHRIVAMACPKKRACHPRGKHPPAKIGRTNKRRQDLSQMHKKPVKNDTFASHPGSHLHYFAEAVSSNAQTLRFRNIAQSTQTSGPLSLVFSGQRSWSRPFGVVGLALVRERTELWHRRFHRWKWLLCWPYYWPHFLPTLCRENSTWIFADPPPEFPP